MNRFKGGMGVEVVGKENCENSQVKVHVSHPTKH